LVLAFAPFRWRFLGVLAPAALLMLWLDSSPGGAFRRGYLFGLGFFGFGVSWVFNSIHVFGQAPASLAGLITVSFVLFLALYPALTGYLANRFFNAPAIVSLVLVYPAMWALLEWGRGWLLTGFPWLTLGQAQLDTPLAGIIPLLGATGASWLAMLSAGLLVAVVVGDRHVRWLGAAAFVSLWLTTGIMGRVSWTSPAGAPLTASLIQGNIAQDEKMNPQRLRPTLKLYRDLSRDHWASDLIIWPESAVPTFYDQIAESFLKPLAQEAQRHQAQLIVGVFVYDPRTGKAYNSVTRLGTSPGFYFKRHLVPFGEYVPLRSLLKWMEDMLVIPMSDLSPGHGEPLLQLPGLGDLAVGMSVCYEDAYGAEINDALPAAALLVNVSNDAWFGDSLAPHQHLEIARLRALETGRYLLRATNTGISAVINSEGEVISRSPQFRIDVLTTKVEPRQGMTPFSWWENWAVVMLLTIALLAALVSRHYTQENARTMTS
jgi:apolipoprotein N-acyltransferase